MTAWTLPEEFKNIDEMTETLNIKTKEDRSEFNGELPLGVHKGTLIVRMRNAYNIDRNYHLSGSIS